MFWHRETGFGAFLYRYRLHPDWRRGPLGDDPVELWLRVLGGKRGIYPEAMEEGAPRECDVQRTRFAMVEPSPSNTGHSICCDTNSNVSRSLSMIVTS